MSRNVGVIGAGSWGTVLAKLVAENGNSTLLWAHEEEVRDEIQATRMNGRYLPGQRLPDVLDVTSDLERLCRSCPFILVVVPSHVFRSVARRMGDFLDGSNVVVHCTKGIEQETFKRMSEILREETCLRKLGVLSGPNLAKELAERHPAGTLVASKYDEVVREAQAILNSATFRVYGGSDVVGAEVGGAFKNIIALAAGIVDGLGLGDNTKALLLTRGLSEMACYGVSMGADFLTFAGMAGIGDLMATCASPLSRNHQVGERIARGETLEEIQKSMFMVAEGVKTTRAVERYAEERGLDLPIVNAVYRILYQGATVRETLAQLMARSTGREFDRLAA